MVHTWTMRYEAKLNFFKQSSRHSNFKNIAYSLANSHQRWMCYEMASGGLIFNQLECGPVSSVGLVGDEHILLQPLQQLFPQLSQESTICRPAWVKVDGIVYKANNAYLVLGTDGLDPIFGRLDDILVINNSVVAFSVAKCKTLYFDEHYHAYAIRITSEQLLIVQ